MKLRLESVDDAFDLDDISETGWGTEALMGVTGFGLPPVQVQWIEGAGDGAIFRGRRVLPRDIDIPLDLRAPNRAALKDLVSRLGKLMSGPMTLRLVENDGTSWYTTVYRVGGGAYVFGSTTIGEHDAQTVVTLRAPDPFWTYSVDKRLVITSAGAGRGLIKGASLTRLRVSGSSAAGSLALENIGNADAYPVWTVTGPGTDFAATGPGGQQFTWEGTLGSGETLVIDSRTASVKDGTGANRYSELASAPRFWPIPPGFSTAQVGMSGMTSESSIIVTWSPRAWAVI